MQMRAYVNDMSRPALEIPFLEGNLKEGEIAFEGLAAFANLVVTPDATKDLSPTRGVDLTNHDANYVRHWLVRQPASLAYGRELYPKISRNQRPRGIPSAPNGMVSLILPGSMV